ncbi:hypothetical protein PG988_015836 [Apiospora saccharicola]
MVGRYRAVPGMGEPRPVSHLAAPFRRVGRVGHSEVERGREVVPHGPWNGGGRLGGAVGDVADEQVWRCCRTVRAAWQPDILSRLGILGGCRDGEGEEREEFELGYHDGDEACN